MAAKPTKRLDLRTQRKQSARLETAKLAQGLPTPDASDEDENLQALTVVQRARSSLSHNASTTRIVAGKLTPLLYAPANHWSIDDVQMFADFYEKYYPPSLQVWRQVTYLRSLVDFTPRTPVLERARRTIGLTHLAAATQDARLIRESRVSYGRLLGMLKFSLMFSSKFRTASETRELAASIALLTHVSDPPNANNKGSDDSWCTHMWAAQQLFTMYAPIFQPGPELLDQGIMRHTAMNGFFLAVAKRRAWGVDPAWFHGLQSKGWTTLIPAFNRLPALLEVTDKALSRQSDASTLLKIVAELSQVRGQTAGLYPEVSRPTTVDTTSMEALDASSEEHLVMADSDTFPELYAPLTKDGGIDAFKVVLTTTLSLVLECTILRVWHFRPETLLLQPGTAQWDMEQSAYLLACRLCKISLSFTQSGKIAHASVLRYCLSLARNVFEQQDRLHEMGWCDACLIANRLRMERIRQTSAPTLCKVEDVTSGIAEAGRYKARFDPQAFVVRAAQVLGMRLLQ